MPDGSKPLVIKQGEEAHDTPQSGGLSIVTGVGRHNTPATRIWTGKTANKPGTRSLPHYHGEAETGAYVLSGHARLFFGPGFAEHIDLATGDYLFVPAFVHHIEANMSTTEELLWLVSRSPGDIVHNLDDVEDAALEGFRRA